MEKILNYNMKLELKPNLKLTQRIIMSPQLQLSIKLLQLSRVELTEIIQKEMERNSALEEAGTHESFKNKITAKEQESSAQKKDSPVKEITIEEKVRPDTDWENYINEYNSTGRIYTESASSQAPNYDALISDKKTLKDHLQWQLRLSGLKKDQEKIGYFIIGNLNKDGYLCSSVKEIATNLNCGIKKVENVLSILQNFDPPGVCARDLCEALLIQVRQIGIDNNVIVEIIKNHLKNIENRNIKAIIKKLKISADDVRAAVKIIQYLEPKPGRKFSTEQPAYITPDIYVYKYEDDFRIVMNDDGLPKLKINKFYKDAVDSKRKLSKDTKDYLNRKMQSASWLIKSINQRQKTIYLVMASILRFQREFFEKGIAYLRPLVLRDVAHDIDMHESTISRITNNKYAYTPQGLFELKYFFSSPVTQTYDRDIASVSVKEKIKLLIKNEDPTKPLNDDQLATILQNEDINIARRTVAKYRKSLNILPSTKRKQL